jgi:hypothetical protein
MFPSSHGSLAGLACRLAHSCRGHARPAFQWTGFGQSRVIFDTSFALRPAKRPQCSSSLEMHTPSPAMRWSNSSLTAYP